MDFELKKWCMDYSEDLVKAMKSQELVEYLRENYPFPFLESHARYFIEQRMFNSEEKQCCRAIVINGHMVGGIDLILGSGLYSKQAELSVWIVEDFRNKGIGTAAVKQICDYAFEKYHIARIESKPYCDENIWISEKLLYDAGFKYEGKLRNIIYKNDKLYSYKVFSIIKTGIFDEHFPL